MKSKKILALLLALAMVLCLCSACGGEAAPEATQAVAATDEPTAVPVADEEPVDEEEPADEEPVDDESSVESIEVPVTITNGTGVDIYALYLSPTGSEAWGEDILGEEVFAADTYIETIFTFTADTLQWDMMMIDSEGTQLPLYGLDFTECSVEGGTIELTFDAESLTGTATLISE